MGRLIQVPGKQKGDSSGIERGSKGTRGKHRKRRKADKNSDYFKMGFNFDIKLLGYHLICWQQHCVR